MRKKGEERKRNGGRYMYTYGVRKGGCRRGGSGGVLMKEGRCGARRRREHE